VASSISVRPMPEKIRTPSSDRSGRPLVEADEIARDAAAEGIVSLKTSVGMTGSSWLHLMTSESPPASSLPPGSTGFKGETIGNKMEPGAVGRTLGAGC
jgi:hypothetical protein